MERGRFLSKADHDKFENYAVIGSDVARTLFPTEDPINQSVKLGTDYYTIVGVVKERANTSAISGRFEERDFNKDVYIPLNTCKLRFGERVVVAQQGAAPWAEECQLSRLTLLLHDDAMVEETAALIRSTLIKPYHPKGDVQVIVIRLQSKSRSAPHKYGCRLITARGPVPAPPASRPPGFDGARWSSCRGPHRSLHRATRRWPSPRRQPSPGSSVPRNRAVTRRDATSRAQLHSAHSPACRAVWL